jgi:hypothetical protein
VNAFVKDNLATVVRQLKKAGPYLLVELLLPGGTLFALLLFVYRNPPPGINALEVPVTPPAVVQAVASMPRADMPHHVIAI